MICPKCSQTSADGAHFCGHCGEPFGVGAASAAPPGTASPPSAGAAAWGDVSAALPGIIERIKNLLLSPKTEWTVIEPEATTVAQLYSGYVMPLAGFSALMTFLRMSVIGIALPFGGYLRTPLLSGLILALLSFGSGLLGLLLVGWIINALAPTFSGERNQRQAIKTAAYAFTPAWLGSLLALIGGLGTLLQLLAALYGIYLLYLGLPMLMKSPREKAAGYTAAAVVCTFLVGIAFGVLSAALGGFGGYGRFPGG